MAVILANSGLILQLTFISVNRDGYDGLKKELSEKDNGKPKVTASKPVIIKVDLCQYLMKCQ